MSSETSPESPQELEVEAAELEVRRTRGKKGTRQCCIAMVATG